MKRIIKTRFMFYKNNLKKCYVNVFTTICLTVRTKSHSTLDFVRTCDVLVSYKATSMP